MLFACPLRSDCRCVIFSVVLGVLESTTDSNNYIQSVQISGWPLKVSSFSVGRLPDVIEVVINCCLWVWSWSFARVNDDWCWCGKEFCSKKFLVVVAWKGMFEISNFRKVVVWLELSVISVEADKVSWGIFFGFDSVCCVCCWVLVGNLVSVSAEMLTRSQLTLNFLRTILNFLRVSRLTDKVSSNNWQCCDSYMLSRKNSLDFSNSFSNCWVSFSPSMNSTYCRYSLKCLWLGRLCLKRNICKSSVDFQRYWQAWRTLTYRSPLVNVFLWSMGMVVVLNIIFEAVFFCCTSCCLFDVDILGNKKSELLGSISMRSSDLRRFVLLTDQWHLTEPSDS